MRFAPEGWGSVIPFVIVAALALPILPFVAAEGARSRVARTDRAWTESAAFAPFNNRACHRVAEIAA